MKYVFRTSMFIGITILATLSISAQTAIGSDSGLWTLNWGEIEYHEAEVHAVPAGGDSRSSYFFSPASFHGDWTDKTELVFEKASSGGGYVDSHAGGTDGDVALENGDMRATYTIQEDHSGEWRAFRVPLEDEGWELSGGAKTLQDVLVNVTSFQIRAEYGYGPDKSAIRGVEIK